MRWTHLNNLMLRSITLGILPGTPCNARQNRACFACWWIRLPTSWSWSRAHPWQSIIGAINWKKRNEILLTQMMAIIGSVSVRKPMVPRSRSLLATVNSGQDKLVRHLRSGLWFCLKRWPYPWGWPTRLPCYGCAHQPYHRSFSMSCSKDEFLVICWFLQHTFRLTSSEGIFNAFSYRSYNSGAMQ